MEKIPVPVKIVRSKKIFSINHWMFSLLVGLVFGGIFCSGYYVLAVSPLYNPGDTLNPSCAPGALGCTVAAPLTDGFTGTFSGTGDLTTTGSFHVKNDNTYQYFGSTDQSKIYFNGTNLSIDVGSGANALTIGDASQTSYKIGFYTSSNTGTIQYTGSTRTFSFANNDSNIVSAPSFQVKNSGGVVYTLPTTAGTANKFLGYDGAGTFGWQPVPTPAPAATLVDGSSILSVDAATRKLLGTDGSTAYVDWSSGIKFPMLYPGTGSGLLKVDADHLLSVDANTYITTSGVNSILSQGGYATEMWVTSSLSSYINSSNLSSYLGSYATTSYVSSALSSYATTASLSSYATTASLSAYAIAANYVPYTNGSADLNLGIYAGTFGGGAVVGVDAATNTAGTMKFWSAGANNYYTTFTAGTQTMTTTYTLPLAAPTFPSQALLSSTLGVMSWGTNFGSNDITTTGLGTFGTGARVVVGSGDYAVNIKDHGILMNDSYLYFGTSSTGPSAYGAGNNVSISPASTGIVYINPSSPGSVVAYNVLLMDSALKTSVNSTNRKLYASDGSTALVSWNNGGSTDLANYYFTAGKLIGDGSGLTGTSDQRLKHDITSLDSSMLNSVMALNPVSFIYNSDESLTKRYGFVAQDVQNIFPSLVTENARDGTLSLYYTDFSAILAKAVQELNLKVDVLAEGGVVNNGGVSGIDTTSYLNRITTALASLGISVSNGITSIANLATQKFSADTATVKYLQMVAANGDIYCTWIDKDGNWQKVKGECSLVPISEIVSSSVPTPEPTAIPTPTPIPNPEVQAEVGQAVQQAQEATQNAVQVTQQAQQAAQTLSNVANQAQQVMQNAQDVVDRATNEVIDNATSKVIEQATPEVVNQAAQQIVSQVNQAAEQSEVVPTPEPTPEPTPTPEPSSPVSGAGEIIQGAAASFLNSMWNFVKWIFVAPLQKMVELPFAQKATAGISSNSATLKEGLPKSFVAGLLEPFKNFLKIQ